MMVDSWDWDISIRKNGKLIIGAEGRYCSKEYLLNRLKEWGKEWKSKIIEGIALE